MRELDHYAQHLRRVCKGEATAPAAQRGTTGPRRDTKAELLAQAEAALCKQQTQFERLVADMRQLMEESREEQRQLAERLQQENEQLRQFVEVTWERSELARQRHKRGSGLRDAAPPASDGQSVGAASSARKQASRWEPSQKGRVFE